MKYNYLERYVWLVNLIKNNRNITLDRIQEAWEICYLNDNKVPLSRRTFFKQLNAIRSTLGIDIRNKSGHGYYIDDGDYTIDRMLDMALASNSLVRFAKQPGMSRRIQVQKTSEGMEHIQIIVEAMEFSKCIIMKFKQYYETEERELVVAPYGLKQFDRRWYLIGLEMKPDAVIREYSLDKIRAPKLSDREFAMPADFSLDAFYNDYYGTVRYESDESNVTVPPMKILLKVWKRERPYFESLPLHSSQQCVAEYEEYSIYHYYMAPTWDIERRLLECNDHVEVLAPQELRDMMSEHAQNMVDMYNGKWD